MIAHSTILDAAPRRRPVSNRPADGPPCETGERAPATGYSLCAVRLDSDGDAEAGQLLLSLRSLPIAMACLRVFSCDGRGLPKCCVEGVTHLVINDGMGTELYRERIRG